MRTIKSNIYWRSSPPFHNVLVQGRSRFVERVPFSSRKIPFQSWFFQKDAISGSSQIIRNVSSSWSCACVSVWQDKYIRTHRFSSSSRRLNENNASKKKRGNKTSAKGSSTRVKKKGVVEKGKPKKQKNVLTKAVLKEYKKQIESMNEQSQVEKQEGEGDKSTIPRVPPAFLAATASPNVWIASCFAEENGIDRSELYAPQFTTKKGSEEWNIPDIFNKGIFDYVSPASFGHELPTYALPEVAFLGRSNAGKSSLINSLTRRRRLALISKTPGRTQQVNYFALYRDRRRYLSATNNHPNYKTDISSTSSMKKAPSFNPLDALGFFVDLPGYGYAEAPDVKVEEWQERTINFLRQRKEVGVMIRVHLLIDSRHGMGDMDRTVMRWLDDAELPYTLVFTKVDLTNRIHLIRYINDACMRFHAQMYGVSTTTTTGGQCPIIHVTSAKTNVGIPELLWSIDADFTNYFCNINPDGSSIIDAEEVI